MPLELKLRPRAFRLGAIAGANAEKPLAPIMIETLADPYEAEAYALIAADDP